MRRIATSLLFVLCVSMAGAAHAQVRLLPYAGYNLHVGLDVERAFSDPRPLDPEGGALVGVGVEIPLPFGALPFALSARPSLETAFVSGATDSFEGGESVEISQRFFQVSADAVAAFSIPGSTVAPFAGLGLAYTRYAASFDPSENAAVVGNTNVRAWALGPTVVGGVRFGGDRVAPFVQARYSFTNPSPAFSGEASGSEIGHGLAFTAGASVGL